jgi:hypothetical protein
MLIVCRSYRMLAIVQERSDSSLQHNADMCKQQRRIVALCTCAEVIAEVVTDCICSIVIILVAAAVPIVAAPAAASAGAGL